MHNYLPFFKILCSEFTSKYFITNWKQNFMIKFLICKFFFFKHKLIYCERITSIFYRSIFFSFQNLKKFQTLILLFTNYWHLCAYIIHNKTYSYFSLMTVIFSNQHSEQYWIGRQVYLRLCQQFIRFSHKQFV